MLELSKGRSLLDIWRSDAKSVETGETRVKLTRHDAHNLELKVFYATPKPDRKISLELFLFMPASLHLGICDKADLIRDFHSRLRLANEERPSLNSIENDVQSLRLEFDRWRQD